MEYTYRIQLGDQRRFSKTRLVSLRQLLSGTVDLEVRPEKEESLYVEGIGHLRIQDIQHADSQAPTIILDGTSLN